MEVSDFALVVDALHRHGDALAEVKQLLIRRGYIENRGKSQRGLSKAAPATPSSTTSQYESVQDTEMAALPIHRSIQTFGT